MIIKGKIDDTITETEVESESESDITPVEQVGNYFFKRDDYFKFDDVNGGKVRTALYISRDATGLVTATHKNSPQGNIIATIGKHFKIPSVIFTPNGELLEQLQLAEKKGAIIKHVAPGYNSVIIARAKEYAKNTGYTYVPFGMECEEAVILTAKNVINIPKNSNRILVPVGSGMTLAGILHGLKQYNMNIKVIGISVGADPTRRLNKFAPSNWKEMCEIISSNMPYEKQMNKTSIVGIELDGFYESKCLPYLKEGDLLWIVGIRQKL